MKKQEMLHWDRRRNAYIDPGYGVEVCVHRVNWIVVAVQIIGGVKRLEYESGYVREDISKRSIIHTLETSGPE